MSNVIVSTSENTNALATIQGTGGKFTHISKKNFFAALAEQDSEMGRGEKERRYDAYLNDFSAKAEAALAAAKAQGLIRAKTIKSSASGRTLAVTYSRITERAPSASVKEMRAENEALRAELAALRAATAAVTA